MRKLYSFLSNNILFLLFQIFLMFVVLIFSEQNKLLLLLLFFIFSVASIFNVKILLYTFFASIWFSSTMYVDVFNVIIRLNDVIIFFLFYSYLCHSALKKNIMLASPKLIDLPILGLLLLGLFSLFTTLNIENTIIEMMQIIELVILYYILRTVIIDDYDIKVFMMITIACGVIDSVWIFNSIILDGIGDRHVAIFGSSGNELAFSILFLYLFALYEKRPSIKIIYYSILILLFISLLFTLGRGLVIIALVMFMSSTIIYLAKKKKLISLIYFIPFLLSFLFIFSIITHESINVRYASIFKGGENVNMRFYNWYSSLLIMKEYPLTGVGLGNGEKYLKSHIPEFAPEIVKKYGGKTPHNEFLHFGIQLGYIGFIFIILFYYKCLRRSFKLIHNIKNNDEIIVNGIFSMVFGLVLWIFANDILLAGMGSLVILVMAFLARLDYNNSMI